MLRCRLCWWWASAAAAAAAPPPQFDGVLRDGPNGTREAYLAPGMYPDNHASNIELLPGGGVAAAWFSGEGEGREWTVALSLLAGGSEKWGATQTLNCSNDRLANCSSQNPVLWYDAGTGTTGGIPPALHLFHALSPAGAKEATAEIWHRSSGDGGRSWSAAAPAVTTRGAYPRNRVIKRLDGTWLLPIYAADAISTCMVGATANASTAEDPASWRETRMPGTYGMLQPSIVRDVPGEPRLTAFYRGRATVMAAASGDDGATWGRPYSTGIPNPDSAIQAVVLASGNWVLACNPSQHDRTPLSLFLSDDGGKTWPVRRDVENAPGGTGEYPSIAQSGDGRIHVSYSCCHGHQGIKYVVIPNEDWIRGVGA